MGWGHFASARPPWRFVEVRVGGQGPGLEVWCSLLGPRSKPLSSGFEDVAFSDPMDLEAYDREAGRLWRGARHGCGGGGPHGPGFCAGCTGKRIPFESGSVGLFLQTNVNSSTW